MRRNSEQGYLIIIALIMVFILTSMSLAILQVASAKYATSRKAVDVDNAVYGAEAGLSSAITKLKANATFTGDSTNQTFDSAGVTKYTTSVTPLGGNEYRIESTGKTYKQPGDTTPSNTKTIRARVTRAIQEQTTNYSVWAGSGGIAVGNGSQVYAKEMYSRGSVRVASGKIGSSSLPAKLDVANIHCSPYPSRCTTNEAISIGNLSGNPSIYGTICANDQTDSSKISTLSSNTLGTCAEVQSWPTMPFDKQAFIASMNPTVDISTLPCTGGVRTIQPKTHITGDVIVGYSSFGPASKCKTTFLGDAYIEGDLTVGTRGQIVAAANATIVLTGKFLSNSGGYSDFNNEAWPSNANGDVARLISFYSKNPVCSANPNVPNPSNPSCLAGGEAQATIDPGFFDDNNAIFCYPPAAFGDQGTDLSGLIVYAYYGIVEHGCEPGTKFAAIAGEMIAFSKFNLTTPAYAVTKNGPVSFTGYWGGTVTVTVTDYQQIF